jgi:hypothetical protein
VSLFLVFAIICNIVWIFPAIRQKGTLYGKYFLILAVLGFYTTVTWFIQLHIPRLNNYSVIIFSAFLPFSLLTKEEFRAWKYLYLLVLCVILVILYTSHRVEVETLVLIGLHLLVLTVFLKQFIWETVTDRAFNSFIIFLITYELSILIRLFYAANGSIMGLYYYFVSMIFEILIGLFFTIFRENNPRLLIHLKFRELA